ncbi:hypothetical protein GCM10010436_76690 [Paractinoplanes durhamensis]
MSGQSSDNLGHEVGYATPIRAVRGVAYPGRADSGVRQPAYQGVCELWRVAASYLPAESLALSPIPGVAIRRTRKLRNFRRLRDQSLIFALNDQDLRRSRVSDSFRKLLTLFDGLAKTGKAPRERSHRLKEPL